MKKAQAAMEFLMTYGWAIIVVLASISALAYFGVLTPSKFLPETCIIAPGFACMDFKITGSTGEVKVVIMNGGKATLTDYSISVKKEQGEIRTGSCTGTSLLIGGATTCTVTNSDFEGEKGERFKASLTFSYTEVEGFSHSKTGVLVTKIE